MSGDVIDLAAWRAKRNSAAGLERHASKLEAEPALPSAPDMRRAFSFSLLCPFCKKNSQRCSDIFQRAHELVDSLRYDCGGRKSSFINLADRIRYDRHLMLAALEGACWDCEHKEAGRRREADRAKAREDARKVREREKQLAEKRTARAQRKAARA